MPHVRQGFPENGSPGLVAEGAPEIDDRIDAMMLEHARHVLYLGKTAR